MFTVVNNIISLFIGPFIKPLRPNIALKKDCTNFFKHYFMFDKGLVISTYIQKLKWSFLQKTWGIAKYPNSNPSIDTEASDVLFSILGALRDVELDLEFHFYEEAYLGIIENGYKTKNPESLEFSKSANFKSRININDIQALTLLCLLSFLVSIGRTDLIKEYNKIKKDVRVLPLIYIPNFFKLEEYLTAYYILSKTSKGLNKKIFNLLFQFTIFFNTSRLNNVCDSLLRKI